MATSSILSWILIFTCSSTVLAEPKGDVLSGAEATKEIEEFVTKRWWKQRWQIEFDERKDWHVKGTDISVILHGADISGEAHDMKSLDVNKVYEFTGVPMDKQWNFIEFYVSHGLKPVELPGTEKRAEQDGADQPATTPLASDEIQLQSGETVRFSGRVEAMLGSSFGFLPPKKGELLRINLDELPNQRLEFTAEDEVTSSYIPFPNDFEMVSMVRYNGGEGRLKSVRLVASDKTWKVTMDLVDGGSMAWILIESRGSIIGVCQLVGELEAIQAEQGVAPQSDTRSESKSED